LQTQAAHEHLKSREVQCQEPTEVEPPFFTLAADSPMVEEVGHAMGLETVLWLMCLGLAFGTSNGISSPLPLLL